MAITGIFEADFSKFNTAVQSADVSLKGFETSASKVESRLNKMADSLDGTKIIQQATLMARAVEAVGGTSKLTADEIGRVSAMAQEAVAKFEALGQTAPKAIQDLATAGKRWEDSFSGLGVSLSAVGVALGAVVAGVGAAAAGFGAMLAHTINVGNSLYEMSLKTGASVENLSRLRYVASQTGIEFDSFGTALFKMEKFLGATGDAADKAQDSLTRLGLNLQTLKNEKPDQAFIDIVSALEKIPNKADQAAIGAAVFGKGWKDMAGLASENIKALLADADRLGLVMTTQTAAAAHAAEVGFKALGLQFEAVQARISAAFLPAIIGLTQNVGTLFKTAVDEAGKSLAAMGGSGGFLDTVARAMGTGNEAIAAQVRLYEYLRDALIGLVRYGFEPLVTAASLVMQVWNETIILGRTVALGYEKITYALEGLLYYSAKLQAFSNPFDKAAAADAATIGRAMTELGNTIADNEAKILDLKKNQTDWAKTGVETNAKVEAALKQLGQTHTDVAAIINDFAERSKNAYGGVGDAVDGVGDKLRDKFAKSLAELTLKIDEANNHNLSYTEKLKLFGAEADKAALEAKAWGIQVSASVQDVADAFNQEKLDKILGEASKKIGEQAKAIGGVIKKAYEETGRAVVTATSEMLKLNEKGEEDSLDKRLEIVQDHFAKERDELNKHVDATTLSNEAVAQNYFYTNALIDANEQRAAAEATQAWQNHLDDMRRIANTITNVFRNAIAKIPQLLTQVFSGNNIGQALTNFTSQIGASLGESLLSAGGALNGVANKLGGGFVKLFGDKIGGALANIIPGIGSAIGSLLGPALKGVSAIFDKVFGTAGRDSVTQFAASFGGFDQLHAKLAALGSAGEKMWIALTQGVGRNNPQQAQAAIDAINKALKGQDDYLSRLPSEMEKYGLSWEQAGKQAEQSHLDSIGADLVQTFADLTHAGFDVSTVTQKMSSDIDDYIHEALRTGTEVPAALKPLLQKMIDLGTLTDDAGNQITDLSSSGLTFSETLTEGFKSVVDAIHEMIDTLTGKGSGSLSGALETIGNAVVSPHIKPILDTPDLPPGFNYGGAQAAGGDYVVSKPTWFLAGEAGTERVSFSGAGKASMVSTPSHVGLLPVTIELAGRPLWEGLLQVAHAEGLVGG